MNFTECCPEHPEVARALRDGYPHGNDDFVRCCPECDAEMTRIMYRLDGRYVCEECFLEWLREYAAENPAGAALDMGIETSINDEYRI